MKIETLAGICKIASKISNPSSLTSLYKAIELGPDSVRCCSEFGNLEMSINPTGLPKKYLIDSEALSSLPSTLPPKSEVTLEEKEGRMHWSCENASGTWNLVQSDYQIPAIDHQFYPWSPQPGLADALILSGAACQAQAVSLGLFGIDLVVDGDKLRIISSNSVTLAQATVDKGTFPKEKITIRPPVQNIIAAFISNCPNCNLDVTDDGIFLEGDWLKAHLPLGLPLDHDLKAILDKYPDAKNVAKVNTLALKKFIARAKALSDRHTSFTVAFKVSKGKIALAHSGIASSTEEFFIAEGLDPNLSFTSKGFENSSEEEEVAAVALPAPLLMIALAFVDTVIVDYLPQQKLILKGSNPDFTYVVSGE